MEVMTTTDHDGTSNNQHQHQHHHHQKESEEEISPTTNFNGHQREDPVGSEDCNVQVSSSPSSPPPTLDCPSAIQRNVSTDNGKSEETKWATVNGTSHQDDRNPTKETNLVPNCNSDNGHERSSKASTPGSPEAVLQLNGPATSGGCQHNRQFPKEDVHEFNSNSAANVTCELKTEAAYPFARLQEELKKAHEELKQKDEEVGRLRCLRDEVGAELEDLTASLFQEAHKMVREAKVKRDGAEKSLTEANMKIEVLQAEVQALKTLVITSTPSMPNRHLHPQLKAAEQRPKENGFGGGGGGGSGNMNNGMNLFRGHKRSPSHNNLKYGRDTTPPGSPVKEPNPNLPQMQFQTTEPFLRDEYEVDPLYHHEFVSWRKSPNLDKTHPFLDRVYLEDILPCLNFSNKELSVNVQKSIEDNSIVIETVSGKNPFPKRCSLLETPRICKYRMKLGDSEQWYYISQLCRNRIAATCDFLSYLRYIQQGLVKNSIHEVYGEILQLRKKMALAKLGFN